jgi:prepilin-type N-terminal cleavage/methylation domain-containing protein
MVLFSRIKLIWNRRRGFTLVELLVVIAIIAFLSTTILSSLNEGRERAQVVKTTRDLQEIEKAFQLWLDESERRTWWTDDELGLGPLPEIQSIIETYPDGLGKFLSVAPVPAEGSYQYDNQDDAFFCGDIAWHGVNIRIEGPVDPSFFNQLDEIVDGGDGADCGKMKMGGGSGSVYYLLGNTSSDI